MVTMNENWGSGHSGSCNCYENWDMTQSDLPLASARTAAQGKCFDHSIAEGFHIRRQ